MLRKRPRRKRGCNMTHVYKIHPKKRRSLVSFFSVTTNLILINVFLFLAVLIFSLFNFSFIDHFVLKPSSVFRGEYLWTFLTSMFMHAGFFHLFANMFSLFFVGSLVEKILGSKRYFWFYIVAGIFASALFVLIEFLFPTNPDIGAVGASGALFGVIGLLMFLTPNLPVYVMFIPIPIKMKYAAPGILVVLWLISIAPLAFGGQQILIGNTAHLGGLIAGVFYGIYLKKKYPNKIKAISRHFS